MPPEPAKPEYPISWYFNSPQDMPWITKTWNTSFDPPLVLVTEVLKTHDISANKSRSVRQHGWQQCLVAKCMLADPFGDVIEVPINWPALVENELWAQNDVVRWVQDWLPGNLDYVGRVLNQPPPQPQLPMPSPPSPMSPEWLNTSTVQIDEVNEESDGEPKPGESPEDQVYRQQRKAVRDSKKAKEPEGPLWTNKEFQEMQESIIASNMPRKRAWLAKINTITAGEVGEVSDDDEAEKERAEKHRRCHTAASSMA